MTYNRLKQFVVSVLFGALMLSVCMAETAYAVTSLTYDGISFTSAKTTGTSDMTDSGNGTPSKWVVQNAKVSGILDDMDYTFTVTNTLDEAVTVIVNMEIEIQNGKQTATGPKYTSNVTYDETTKICRIKLDAKSGSSPSATFTISCKECHSLFNHAQTTVTTKFTDWIVQKNTGLSINLGTPVNGSYTATNSETSATIEDNGAQISGFAYDLDNGVALIAYPNDGYQFVGWYEEKANGTSQCVSNSMSDTLKSLTSGSTITPIFGPANYDYVYYIGFAKYAMWSEAVEASISTGLPIILKPVTNGTYTLTANEAKALADGESVGDYVTVSDGAVTAYTLPAGAKLLVPCTSTDTGVFSDTGLLNTTPTVYTTPKVYASLVIPENIALNVTGGQINVNAKINSRTANMRNTVVSECYGQIELKTGASINLTKDGDTAAKLFCYGYITGEGKVDVSSGCEVYELLQFCDFPGGNATTSWAIQYNASKDQCAQFLLSQYYIQNVESSLCINAGGVSKIVGYVYAKVDGVDQYVGTSGTIVGSGGLFELSSGKLERRFSSSDGRMIYDLYGTINTGTIGITLGNSEVTSEKCVLPLGSTMTINMKSGSKVSMGYRYSLLPGCEVNIESGAQLTVANGAYLFIWDVKDWNQGSSDGSYTYNSVPHTIAPYTATNGAVSNRHPALTESGQIHVEGTLIAYNNIMVTQNTSRSDSSLVNTNPCKVITCAEGGVFQNNSGTVKSKIYPYTYVGGLTGVSFDTVTAIGAVGRMADGEYKDDITAVSGAVTSYEQFATGVTYYGLDDETWYTYTVSYTFVDADGNELPVSKNAIDYITKDNVTLAMSDIDSELTGTEKYYITGYSITSGTATVTDADGYNAFADNGSTNGCVNLTLSGISGDVEITLTVDTYDHQVVWSDYVGDISATPTRRADYITGNSASYVWSTVVGFTEVTAIKEDATDVSAWMQDPVVEASVPQTTLSCVGISDDVFITMVTTRDIYEVKWKILDSAGEEIETINEYVHKDVGTESLSVSDIQTAPTGKYIIMSYSVYAGDTQLVKQDNADLETIELDNVDTHLTVDVTVGDYQSVVTFAEGETALRTQYVTAEGSKDVYGSAVSYSEVSKTPRRYISAYTSPAAAEVVKNNVNETPAAGRGWDQITLTGVTQDETIDLALEEFDYKVQWTVHTDDKGAVTDKVFVNYVTGSTDTCEATSGYHFADQSEDSGIELSNDAGTAEVSVAQDMSVEIEERNYTYSVKWYQQDEDGIKIGDLETDYWTEGEANPSYNCAAKKVAMAMKYNSSVNFVQEKGPVIEVGLADDEVIGVVIASYDYTVCFDDGTTKAEYYVLSGGSTDVLDGSDLYYQASGTEYITDEYTVSNPTNVSVAKKYPSGVTGTLNGDNGCTMIMLSNVTADQVVTIPLAEYDHMVIWRVSTVIGTEDPVVTRELCFSNQNVDSYTVQAEYNITGYSEIAAVDDTGKTVTVQKQTDDSGAVKKLTEVEIEVQDFLYQIIWTVEKDGVTTQTTQSVKSNDDVIWTMPADDASGETETSYVIGEVIYGNCEITKTNTTLTVKRTNDADVVTVSVKLEEALNNYSALWGDMSYKYYKNGAYYSWDETQYVWRLIDTYAWTHKTGGVVRTYWDLYEAKEIDYFVPNGSVMIVNPTNQIIKATVTVDHSNATWAWTNLVANNAEKTTGTNTITVVLQPHTSMLISGSVSGTPPVAEMTDLEIGSWTVNIEPTD